MGMKVSKVTSLEQDNDSATLVADLQAASGVNKMKVTWEFTFKKVKGTWQVQSHKKL